MPYDEVRKRYRNSEKGHVAARSYANHYYHTKLKFNLIEREKRKYRNRTNYYLREYGLTVERAAELKTRGCDLCGVKEGKLNIDHKHGENGYRGVLCNPCNLLVGWIELNHERLPQIFEYIKRPSNAI